ncbi:cell division protein FtsX [Methylohalomonas lacus]|uniref:Cell division protein FtsX n=1 Tax=Methylohalomonas lacus TaxID=398773 RepID=A0AAE3HKK6_9GAMM|nr:hypothetical protein [Methylohalomonas lacus]MCS3902117.1 cell division protein FtsX [Methylohalomonas lacus]
MSITNHPSPVNSHTQRSAFVSVVAWVFIVLGGFATFIAVMQNIAVHFLLSAEQLQQMAPNAFTARHIGTLFLCLLLLAVVTLTAAIALLKRRNWGRRLFVALMGLVIVWNIASLLLQQQSAREPATGTLARQDFASGLDILSLVLAVALSLLCGWIAWRLCRPAIVAEFQPNG